MPSAEGALQVVDRVVALPLRGSSAEAAAVWAGGHSGWGWAPLGGLTCALVYALAAMAVSRVRTYFPSSSRAVLQALSAAPALWRSGAREARGVKRSRDPEGGRSTSCSGAAFSTWADAKARALAADQALARALLAIPDSDPDAEDLHAFAHRVSPWRNRLLGYRL